MKKAIALGSGPVAEPVGRVVKLLVASFLAAAVIAVVVPDYAEAQAVDPSIADSDGYVPIYRVCVTDDQVADERGAVYDLAAAYVPYYDGYSVEGFILLNECALQKYGAGPNDIQRVLDHELGHAAGLLDSDDPSSIMYPFYDVTGT